MGMERTWKSFCFSFFRLALDPMIAALLVLLVLNLRSFFSFRRDYHT